MNSRNLVQIILIVFVIYMIPFGLSSARTNPPSTKGGDLFVSALPVCFCFSVNIGVVLDKDSIGVNAYKRLGVFSGGDTQVGMYMRSFLYDSSFFVTSRLGWMETILDHPDYQTDKTGVSAGVDFGNQWFYDSGFTQGVTWIGVDFFVDEPGAGLPHGLRYEVGLRF